MGPSRLAPEVLSTIAKEILEHQRGCGIPKVVNSYSGEARTVEERIEVPRPEVRVVDDETGTERRVTPNYPHPEMAHALLRERIEAFVAGETRRLGLPDDNLDAVVRSIERTLSAQVKRMVETGKRTRARRGPHRPGTWTTLYCTNCRTSTRHVLQRGQHGQQQFLAWRCGTCAYDDPR